MILYRKVPQLRVRPFVHPEPPFWAATVIAPYGNRRGAPVSIDYLELRATFSERVEVTVCESVESELERATQRQRQTEPVLIEAAEFCESVFQRGQIALDFCGAERVAALHLVSTRGSLPERVPEGTRIVIATWPLDFAALQRLFDEARGRALRWGALVPVIFPVTTNLDALTELAEMAHDGGASFLAAVAIEMEPTAKHAMASSMTLGDDEETYETLFHANLEPLHVATERHIAALAESAGMADFVVPPRWEERSNWNGSVLLTIVATRMLALGHDVELAGRIARSARAVARLEKPVARIAESASLSIVDTLDEVTIDILTEWIETGRAAFADHINKIWRLRRDHGAK